MICPNCLQPIQYGKLINNTGHVACPDCYDTLAKNIADIREHNYEYYRNAEHLYLVTTQYYNDYVCQISYRLINYYKKVRMEMGCDNE